MKGFFENLGFFASRFNQAIVITIELSIISLIAATIIGIIVGLVNTSKSKSVIMKILKAIANLYIYIIRGTPMLVQIGIKNSIFRNSLIFQGLSPIKYQNLMYFPLILPL